MRRLFNVGELVTWIPDRFLRRAAPGDYRIIAAMPDRDGEHIVSDQKPSRRVRTCRKGKSSRQIRRLLARKLPKHSRRRAITIPTLQHMQGCNRKSWCTALPGHGASYRCEQLLHGAR
jgi:hypothetical protein